MLKTVDYVSNGQQRQLTLTDSAAFSHRFETTFGTTLHKVMVNKDDAPEDLGLRIAYCMVTPKPSVDYEHWIEDCGINMKENFDKITNATMDFMDETISAKN